MSTTNKTNANIELEAILDRIRGLTGAKSDADIHRELDCSPSAIPTWRKRGTVPYSSFVAFARKKGVSLDWLLNGIGPRYLAEWGAALSDRATLEIREKPATFKDHLQRLKEASDLIISVTQERDLHIDSKKGADVLHFVYHYNLDAAGVLQLLLLLATDGNTRERGES